jgi:hypothetical protein
MHHVEPLREVALTGSERRHGHRRRVLKGAMIVYNNGHCTLGCQILDMSETGARVMPADIFLTPPNLFLNPASARHEIVKLSGEKRTPSAYVTSDPVK